MSCPHYSCVSKQAKTALSFKTKNKGTIQHLTIDFTGLNAYGEDEWEANKHDTDGKQ
ncbi:Mobile element protein [Candidatus Enterovibrio altilux]|uniref:Mobile element protein n=1 Tax=Candidatus Enterovibrio altilux TaxID=1927128 RepID=A0A291B983_9GAMM|nr:Mobile element protein [Candidatus Enterovibrio luxaltus]